MRQHFLNIQSMLEEIRKREKTLEDKKEKLWGKGDPNQWELNNLAVMKPEEVQVLVKDKVKSMAVMLPKET